MKDKVIKEIEYLGFQKRHYSEGEISWYYITSPSEGGLVYNIDFSTTRNGNIIMYMTSVNNYALSFNGGDVIKRLYE